VALEAALYFGASILWCLPDYGTAVPPVEPPESRRSRTKVSTLMIYSMAGAWAFFLIWPAADAAKREKYTAEIPVYVILASVLWFIPRSPRN
jgi:hypothetical protein